MGEGKQPLCRMPYSPGGSGAEEAVLSTQESDDSQAHAAVDPRLAVVLQMEWTMLAARYLGYFVLLALHAVWQKHSGLPNLLPITLGVVVHNTFVHWVFYTRRFGLFTSLLNFFMHLGNISLLVGLTGGDQSPFALLYILFIIGFALYTRRFPGTFRATISCCTAYAAMILLSWAWRGLSAGGAQAVLYFVAIISSGWLVSLLSEIVRNIQVQAEQQAQALASSEAALRGILDNTASPILVYGENEFITEVNDRACEYLGVSRERLIGQRFRSFLFDDGTLPTKLASLRSKGEYHGENIILSEDGKEHTADLLVRSFVRKNQRYFVTMIHDITVQKDVQESARLANLQLERLNRELQQLNELRTAFFMTISRRLRSPMAALLGFVDMLTREELGEINDEQRKALQTCRRSVNRVFALIDETIELEDPDRESKRSQPTHSGAPES